MNIQSPKSGKGCLAQGKPQTSGFFLKVNVILCGKKFKKFVFTYF